LAFAGFRWRAQAYTLKPGSNVLASIAGVAVQHDAAGNLTQWGNLGFTWNELGQLETLSRNGQTVATYAYDWRGLRTRKTTTAQAPQGALTTLYHYDPEGHLIGESTVQANSLTPQKTYLWRDDTLTGVVVHQPTRQVAVILTDHLGSPIEVHDMSGALLWTWYADAFGTTLPDEDPGHTGRRFTLNIRFPGQYYDAESGLHYNGQRYYAPTLGRYISSDPVGLVGGSNT
jgi:RHS repeat-associated protein